MLSQVFQLLEMNVWALKSATGLAGPSGGQDRGAEKLAWSAAAARTTSWWTSELAPSRDAADIISGVVLSFHESLI